MSAPRLLSHSRQALRRAPNAKTARFIHQGAVARAPADRPVPGVTPTTSQEDDPKQGGTGFFGVSSSFA